VSDGEKRYALRLVPQAERDIDAAIVHFADISGFEIAELWRGRLFEEIARLATNPARFPVIPEMQRLQAFPHEFRHLV
jgi:plasmid stabilization system protein ParE